MDGIKKVSLEIGSWLVAILFALCIFAASFADAQEPKSLVLYPAVETYLRADAGHPVVTEMNCMTFVRNSASSKHKDTVKVCTK